MKISDLKQIITADPLTACYYLLPGGKTNGDNYIVLNPLRPDKKPGSFMVGIRGQHSGYCIDYADGWRRFDLIDLCAQMRGVSQVDAARELAGVYGQPGFAQRAAPAQTTAPAPQPTTPDAYAPALVSPIPDNAPPLPDHASRKDDAGKWLTFPFTHTWPYRDRDGRVLCYVVRYNGPDGKKETPQYTLWRQPDGNLKWSRKGVPAPRPLFNLDLLTSNPAAAVIVVEGEKKAAALQQLIDTAGLTARYIATCWIGGAQGTSRSDFSPLDGRRLFLWPDNDKPGRECMAAIAARLTGTVMVMDYPADQHPAKWDVADAIADGWDLKRVFEFIKATARPVTAAPVSAAPTTAPTTTPATNPDPDPDARKLPFRCAGYDHDHVYFIPDDTRQVLVFKASQLGKGAAISIAPRQAWERSGFSGDNGVDYTGIQDFLIRSARKHGVFDVTKFRGRGAWYDNGRVVIHLGDRLLVDNKPTQLEHFKSRYIYEALPPIEFQLPDPLPVSEAYRLRQITDSLFWERSISSRYLAGWCVIAPICGALKSRPHVWLTGGAGSGKSYVLDEIVQKILGDFKVYSQGATTEAGIRRELNSDALPVIQDEFDADDSDGIKRLQDYLTLARQAFSDSEAKIFKAALGGNGTVKYQIRSAFLFSSINVCLSRQADESRVSVIGLTRPLDRPEIGRREHFAKLQAAVSATITPEWAAAFRSRSYRMIPTIRHNAEVFAVALAERLGNRRSGDQAGPLLAGAYSLSSDAEISPAKAEEWIASQDWTESTDIANERDELKCINFIGAALIRDKSQEVSVSEALTRIHDITLAVGTSSDPMGDESLLASNDALLRRHGIRYSPEDDLIFIADGHPQVQKILEKTPWPRGVGRLLKRIDGSVQTSKRFAGGLYRCTGIPWSVFFPAE